MTRELAIVLIIGGALASCIAPNAQPLPVAPAEPDAVAPAERDPEPDGELLPEVETIRAHIEQESAPPSADLVTASGITISTPEQLAADERITVESRRYTFEGASGVAWHASVARNTVRATVVAETTATEFDDLLPVEESGGWVAINGGFYDRAQQAMGLAIVQGDVVTELNRGGGSGVFEVHADEVRIVHRDNADPAANFALQSIDRIADQGLSLVSEVAHAGLAARSAVAVTPTAVVLVVLVDDGSIDGDDPRDVQLSATSGIGLPLWAFAEYVLATTSATEVLNLDGSVSTQLAARVGDETIRVRGVRGTPNAIVLR